MAAEGSLRVGRRLRTVNVGYVTADATIDDQRQLNGKCCDHALMEAFVSAWTNLLGSSAQFT